MKIPKYKLGDTIVLNRRWFLGFREWVLCEVMFGRYDEEAQEWRYTLRIGNQFRRFCIWESEITPSNIPPTQPHSK